MADDSEDDLANSTLLGVDWGVEDDFKDKCVGPRPRAWTGGSFESHPSCVQVPEAAALR